MKVMNKILAVILAAVTVLTFLPVCVTAKSAVPGDVDGNGKVEAADALRVLDYSVQKIRNIDSTAADFNRDGKVNSADALAILKTAVGLAAPAQTAQAPQTVQAPQSAQEVHKAKPIGKVTKTWEINKTNFYAKIERLAYGAEQTLTVNASNVASYNKQIVNYKTVKYWPMANVAVITPKNGTLLRFSKGTSPSDPETIAVNNGAVLAVNGVCTMGSSDYYETQSAATVRDGAVYKAYAGQEGKAATRMVIYKNGDWKVTKNFDNATAREAVKNGAWISVPYMDLTMYEGKVTSHFKKADGTFNEGACRNRTVVGHTYDGKIIFLTSEMMPMKYVTEILTAYNCRDAVFLNGGNSTYMYAKGFGNTTGSTGKSVKDLNKIGYLETEWYAKNGFLAAGKGGGPSHTDLDVAYFK